jgi:thioredoxin reductase
MPCVTFYTAVVCRSSGPNLRVYYLETNIPGIFAAGDVRHGSVKRFASAVGEGAMAVHFIHRYLTADEDPGLFTT